MLRRNVGYRACTHVQRQTVSLFIPVRAVRIPRRADIVATKARHTISRADVTCRAQVRPNVQLPSATSGSVERNCRSGMSFLSYTRMIFLTGVMAASVFLDKKSAHAATPPTPVVTQDRQSAQPTRRVWTALKSAGNAPFYALDHLLFPDADEPIGLIRTSREFTAECPPVATAKPSLPAYVKAKNTPQRGEAAHTTAAPPPVITAPQAPPKTNNYASKVKDSVVAATRPDLAAHYVSSAAANSYQQLSSSLSAVLTSLAPSWPAESAALSGLSQLPNGLRSRVFEAGGAGHDRESSAVLARQLVRGAYALAGIVVAVMAWQLAAAVSEADRSAKKTSKAKTVSAASAAHQLQQAVLVTDSGVSAAALQPATAGAAAADTSAVDKQQLADVVQDKVVVGPYCRMRDQPPEAAADIDAVHEALTAETAALQPAAAEDPEMNGSLNGSLAVVGPYCLRRDQALQPTAAAADVVPEALVAETAAVQAAAAADDPEMNGSLAVVGPYCLRREQTWQPATSAAADVVREALGAEAAAMEAGAAADVVREALVAEAAALQAAAEATASDAELSVVLTTETAWDTAQAVVTTAIAAAAAAAGQHDESASPAAGDSTVSSNDNEPLFRVEISPAPSGGVVLSLSGAENFLAAEAVREALIAESAAATAAVAAERANAAAHKIEEAIMEVEAHSTSAAEQHKVESGTSALTDSAPPGDEDAVWQLAVEAKQAEAAAAVAAIRKPADFSNGSSTLSKVAVDQGELHTLIAEAIAAEAAAAGIAANVHQAELVAEAMAAEAAAAAALAAADAAGSAASADVSAGQAAELAKCHLCGPRADSAAAGSSGGQLQLSSSVSVSWVLSSADDTASRQLTALAAATAHPAIVTSTTTATGTVLAAAPAAVDDADAFKDEFPMDSIVSIDAAILDGDTSAPAADSKTCSLADALNVASQIQMQAASAIAVKQAHERLVRTYKSRRPAVHREIAQQQAANKVPAQKLFKAVPTAAMRKLPADIVAKAAAGYLGVSDLALALALAQLDSRETGKSKGGPSKGEDRQTDQSNDVAQTASAAPSAAAEDSTVATPPALEAPAEDAAAVVLSPEPESVVKPGKPGEITVTYADSSCSSGSFDVPVMVSGANPYTALAEALRNSRGDSSCPSKGDSSTDEAISKVHTIPVTDSSSSEGFEVAVVTEGPRGAMMRTTNTRSSKVHRDLRQELRRGVTLQHYVPLKGGRPGPVGNAVDAASSASTATLARSDSGISSGAHPGDCVGVMESDSAKPADKAAEGASAVGDTQLHVSTVDGVSSTSIPVEWVTTPNSSKRAELHQRAAALLAAQTAAEPEPVNSNNSAPAETQAADRSAVSTKRSGTGQFSGVASTAAALVADEIDNQVRALLSSAAGRLDMGMNDAYGMPDIFSKTAAADALPPGWGTGSATMALTNTPTTTSSSSWSEVSAQLAADLEDELAGLLTSAAARLDFDTMFNAYGMPQVPLPAAADICAAETTAVTGTADDNATTEPFGRYVPVAQQDKDAPSSICGTADA